MMTVRHRLNKRLLILIFSICFSILGGNRVYAEGFTHYRLGVFPFMPMSALVKYFNSVGMDLTHQLNKRIIAQTRPTFEQFSQEIEKETYDIIFIQPFDYPVAYQHNYRPLVRRSEGLVAILVTSFDSNINTISDLAGKTLASPPQESAIANIIKKELLTTKSNELDSIKIIYTRNHFACIQTVLVGNADACSTTTPVLYHWQNSGMKKEKLRIIHTTEAIPHSLYMAHKRVPEQDQEKIRQAIITWNIRPEGKMILKQFTLDKFVEAKDSEYDVIRNYWK